MRTGRELDWEWRGGCGRPGLCPPLSCALLAPPDLALGSSLTTRGTAPASIQYPSYQLHAGLCLRTQGAHSATLCPLELTVRQTSPWPSSGFKEGFLEEGTQKARILKGENAWVSLRAPAPVLPSPAFLLIVHLEFNEHLLCAVVHQAQFRTQSSTQQTSATQGAGPGSPLPGPSGPQ